MSTICSSQRVVAMEGTKGLLKLPMLILFASCTPVIGLPFQQSIMGGQSQVGVSNGVEAV